MVVQNQIPQKFVYCLETLEKREDGCSEPNPPKVYVLSRNTRNMNASLSGLPPLVKALLGLKHG